MKKETNWKGGELGMELIEILKWLILNKWKSDVIENKCNEIGVNLGVWGKLEEI